MGNVLCSIGDGEEPLREARGDAGQDVECASTCIELVVRRGASHAEKRKPGERSLEMSKKPWMPSIPAVELGCGQWNGCRSVLENDSSINAGRHTHEQCAVCLHIAGR